MNENAVAQRIENGFQVLTANERGQIVYSRDGSTWTTSPAAVALTSLGERDACGLYPLADDAVPANTVAASIAGFDLADGVVQRHWTVADAPLGPRQAVLAAAVDARWTVVAQSGYTHDFGGEIGEQTFQTRFPDGQFCGDQALWLGLKDACNDAIKNERGDEIVPIPLRPVSNENFTVTYVQANAMLSGMRTQQSAILAYSWALKSFIEGANDHATLDLLDVSSGIVTGKPQLPGWDAAIAAAFDR